MKMDPRDRTGFSEASSSNTEANLRDTTWKANNTDVQEAIISLNSEIKFIKSDLFKKI